MDFISYDFREGQIVELFHGRPQAAWEIDSAPDKVLRNVIAWAERQKEFDDYERVEGDISAIELVRKHIPADRLAEFSDQKDITFYVTEETDGEDIDGFVVHYVDSTGSTIWSEFYETMDDIRVAYREEIKSGQFEGGIDNE
jgi:hypothetical protein